jgi:hypothetical protein
MNTKMVSNIIRISSGKSIPRDAVRFNSVDRGSVIISNQKSSAVLFIQNSKANGISSHTNGAANI